MLRWPASSLSRPLDQLYETAVYANPATREKVLTAQRQQEEAKRVEEAKAKAASARKAGSSVTGAPGSGQAPQAANRLPNFRSGKRWRRRPTTSGLTSHLTRSHRRSIGNPEYELGRDHDHDSLQPVEEARRQRHQEQRLLRRLSQKGKVKPVDGGQAIVQEMEYSENGTYQALCGL
jgi:hypothetical protein